MNTASHRPSGRMTSGSVDHLADGLVRTTSGADSLPDSTDKVTVSRTKASTSDTSTTSAASSVGRVVPRGFASLMSERDMAIIRFTSAFRYVTGSQLIRLFFVGHASSAAAARSASAVLSRLVAGRALRRAERRIGGLRGGSASYVYGIGPLGHRLLHQDGSRGRWDEPSGAFLEHTLAITELAVQLQVVTRERIAGSTVQDRNDDDPQMSGPLRLTPEPRCWRSFQIGLSGIVTLKPDLHAVITSDDKDGRYEDHWFCEIDRGTESSTALTTKLKTYLDYFRTGVEQQRTGLFPRVLWVVPNDRRAQLLCGIIQKMARPATADDLFTVVTSDCALDVLMGHTGGQQ